MRASEFTRHRDRIEADTGKKGDKYREAMASLLKRARAVLVVVNDKIVGYRMTDGSFVCLKKRFATMGAADYALERITESPRTDKIPVRVYQCERCNGWHLTSKRS